MRRGHVTENIYLFFLHGLFQSTTARDDGNKLCIIIYKLYWPRVTQQSYVVCE